MHDRAHEGAGSLRALFGEEADAERNRHEQQRQQRGAGGADQQVEVAPLLQRLGGRHRALASPDERHLVRHHRHEQHVGIERQARHVDDRVADVSRRPCAARSSCAPSGCRTPSPCTMRSVNGVAALPMSICPQQMSYCRQSSEVRFGQAGDRVLGRGVGDRERPRRVRGDRAVVDDAAAARVLRLHDLDGFLGAQEHAGEIGGDHVLPGSRTEDPPAGPGARRCRHC